MIYKTWFGKHIDLSKVVSISDVLHKDDKLLFEIEYQLEEKPRYYIFAYNPLTEFPLMQTIIPEGFIGIDGKEYPKYTLQDNLYKFKPAVELQQKIDELVKVWKDFKKSEKKCNDCANYKKRVTIKAKSNRFQL
jgi:hypothetical protein